MNSRATEGDSSAVNYDCEPVLEATEGQVQYRLDAGKQGTALCVSQRDVGSWDWRFVGEARWDRITLRCKSLPRPICEKLGRVLREVAASA